MICPAFLGKCGDRGSLPLRLSPLLFLVPIPYIYGGPTKDAPILIPGICEYVTLFGQKGLCRGNEVTDFKLGRLFWVIGMDPI